MLAAESLTREAGLAAGTKFVHDCHTVLMQQNWIPSFLLTSLPSFFHSVQLTKAHRQGHMVKVDWLDRLTFREIEMINEVSFVSLDSQNVSVLISKISLSANLWREISIQ